MDFRFDEHDTGEVTLCYTSIGAPDAPLVVCLHGFPEYWAAWREVMSELFGDFHLVAPDQRGYNRSSKPKGIESYRASRMVKDLASLADRLSPDRPFVLAGHDWGASVAHAYAFRHPERLSHLVIANGVHPACFQRAILDVPEQREASQYINKLRAGDAEARLSEDDFRRLFRMIERFSHAPFMTPEAKAGYREAWRQPGALTAMLNWYRASPIVVPEPDAPAPENAPAIPREAVTVRMPHLIVWGDADRALRPACLDGIEDFCTAGVTVEHIADAGHWILHEKPRQVAASIRAFIAEP